MSFEVSQVGFRGRRVWRHGVTAATIVLLAWSALLSAQPAARRDGRWDVKMETSYGGRDLSTNVVQCITKEQLSDPMNTLPGGPDAQHGCRMSKYTLSGQSVTGTVTCDGPPVATTRIEYVYQADTYVGVMTMDRNGQTITTRLTGTRLGDCVVPVGARR